MSRSECKGTSSKGQYEATETRFRPSDIGRSVPRGFLNCLGPDSGSDGHTQRDAGPQNPGNPAGPSLLDRHRLFAGLHSRDAFDWSARRRLWVSSGLSGRPGCVRHRDFPGRSVPEPGMDGGCTNNPGHRRWRYSADRNGHGQRRPAPTQAGAGYRDCGCRSRSGIHAWPSIRRRHRRVS